MVFARYQLVIFAMSFIYYVVGLLIFITEFCYRKQLSLERMFACQVTRARSISTSSILREVDKLA